MATRDADNEVSDAMSEPMPLDQTKLTPFLSPYLTWGYRQARRRLAAARAEFLPRGRRPPESG